MTTLRRGDDAARPGTTSSVVDEELAVRIRAGDVQAFNEVFRRYYRPLCRFVLVYTHSPSLAEELVQDVFTSLWARRDALKVTSTLRVYLHSAARNRATSYLRRKLVERRWYEEAKHGRRGLELASRPSDVAGEVEASELAAAVHRLVALMPERRRIIYMLSRDQQLSYAEIAEVLGIAPKTVEIQIGRALKDLREGLRAAGWETP